MSFPMKFGRNVLEGYLAVAIVILTVVAYVVLAGVGFEQQSGFIMLALLMIILIGVNILISIINLRILERVEYIEQHHRSGETIINQPPQEQVDTDD